MDTSAKTLAWAVGVDGIAIITIDLPGRPMNVITAEFQAEFAQAVEQILERADISGAIVTSGKSSGFIVGADINDLAGLFSHGLTPQQGADLSRSFSKQLRRLETGGKPFACAINGLALGGGFELALACHFRVLADSASVGLPEVTIGLLPGAGGTQRLPRLIGIEKAEPILLTGRTVNAAEALKLGLVQALRPQSETIECARQWLLSKPKATQPWDEKHFVVPQGAGPQAAHAARSFTAATALTAQTTQRNYPAPLAILSCIFEGTQLTIEAGLDIESKYFGQLIAGTVARNMMRTLFLSKNAADKLAFRPAGINKVRVKRLGVLGAGMMGAGIAYVAAKAGVDVVLLDASLEQSAKGQQFAKTAEKKRIERGEISVAQLDAILARIKPTTEFADLNECDLVIEAVFESRPIKVEVIGKAGQAVSNTAIFASNTSTLPISELAKSFPRPDAFLGLHFFSPVEKMPLVEVIVGQETSAATLAHGLDFVGLLKKTPIVVNDGPGFYTSRVFGAFFQEGILMLLEGVHPALIENSARAAGMPVGPLAVCDEVSMELQLKVIEQNIDDGQPRTESLEKVLSVLRLMVIEKKRSGRRAGAGFYDYSSDGKKQLWSGLTTLFAAAGKQPSSDEVKQRILFIQALEAARCYESKVVTRPEDADLGSILGVGFPAWTGGTLSYIDTYGASSFVAEAHRLARQYGPRFVPANCLEQFAATGLGFYVTAGQKATLEA